MDQEMWRIFWKVLTRKKRFSILKSCIFKIAKEISLAHVYKKHNSTTSMTASLSTWANQAHIKNESINFKNTRANLFVVIYNRYTSAIKFKCFRIFQRSELPTWHHIAYCFSVIDRAGWIKDYELCYWKWFHKQMAMKKQEKGIGTEATNHLARELSWDPG